ncbi:MAG: 16S rRNA (cytosine(967)-C(5))-methyltransferase RsmB [Lachnospiraceae bacterium]|nr:16S rRNA (cytosine(967)-C(5))-methyltransferase RsmB [Lachnospiraceae bacterium]
MKREAFSNGSKKKAFIRRIALESLLLIDKKGEKSDQVLGAVLSKYSYLDRRDLSYINRAVNGTLEMRLKLDYIIEKESKVPIRKLKPVVLEILRLSLYEFFYMDRIPERATISEALRLCDLKGLSGLKGYVNGVLSAVSRDRKLWDEDNGESLWPKRKDSLLKYLSVTCSMPSFITERLIGQYGEDIAETVLKDQLSERPVYIRTNESRVSKDELKELLRKEGIEAEDAPYPETALIIKHKERAASSEAFKNGLCFISDIGAMLAVSLSGIKSGDRVMDVCAAPGGKTCHALDILNGSGYLLARDISEKKLELIRENIERQGFKTKYRIEAHDALTRSPELYESFDVLIADLPCSGLGVMGRKKDIKYRLKEEDFSALAKLQKEILKVCTDYIKPGGTLMFCTCTIDREENEDNYDFIIRELPFEPVSLSSVLPEGLECESPDRGYIQLFPGIHGSDGFFIARFRKIGTYK